MKKILVILLLLLCLPVFANEKTWITDNFDGKVIITPEYVITIFDYDTIDSALWLPGDDIIIIDDEYVVNAENGEKVEIQNIRYR